MLTSKSRAQPGRKSELNGKAQPFLTTGGEAVANHNGFLVAAPLRRISVVNGFQSRHGEDGQCTILTFNSAVVVIKTH